MNKRPQIVATIGPSSWNKHVLKEMISHHMDIARLNFSWGEYSEHEKVIKHIREASAELEKKILIIQDLSGPRKQEIDGHEFNKLALKIITEKDLADLAFGISQKIDYVAMSFVGSHFDVLELKNEIKKAGASIPVIAKIERKVAVKNIDEIIKVSDAIMIARGDLGNEVSLEQIPFIEKMILEKCKAAGKPVITATQMLLSMISNEKPTRAEVTDVAFAIISGSDAVMLSEESANGKYPVEAVEMMNKIIIEADKHLNGKGHFNTLS